MGDLPARAPRLVADWRIGAIRQFGDVQAGKARNMNSTGALRPYLRVANVFDGRIDTRDVLSMPFSDQEFERYLIRDGDILLNEGQSLDLVGRCSMYRGEFGGPCAIQNALVRFRADPQLADPGYCEQLFRWYQQTGIFASIATQTTSIAHLGVTRFANLSVGMPPLPEQRKIAAILSSVDEAIEKTQAVIDQVQVVKKGLMQELLTKGLPGRHKSFKQTEIGPIPEGWDAVRLGDIATEMRYGTSAKCSAQGEGDPVLRIPNVVAGTIDDTSLKYAVLPTDEKRRYSLESGDILFVRTNGNPDYVGRCSVMDSRGGVWLYASYIIRVRVRRDRIEPHFVQLCCSEGSTHAAMRGSVRTSAGNYNINTKGLAAAYIPLPPIAEQREILDVAQSIDDRIRADVRHAAALQRLKSALMSVLLTGELRVTPSPDPT